MTENKKELKVDKTLYELGIVSSILSLFLPFTIKLQLEPMYSNLSVWEKLNSMYPIFYLVYGVMVFSLLVALYFCAYRFTKLGKGLAITCVVMPLIVITVVSTAVGFYIGFESARSKAVPVRIPYNYNIHQNY